MKPTKNEKKLFYSWQSDSDERVNKILQPQFRDRIVRAKNFVDVNRYYTGNHSAVGRCGDE